MSKMLVLVGLLMLFVAGIVMAQAEPYPIHFSLDGVEDLILTIYDSETSELPGVVVGGVVQIWTEEGGKKTVLIPSEFFEFQIESQNPFVIVDEQTGLCWPMSQEGSVYDILRRYCRYFPIAASL